jgi:hypothetical protein
MCAWRQSADPAILGLAIVEGRHTITKTMNEGTQLTQPQRKALVDMLKPWGDVWERAKKRYEATRDSRTEAIIQEVAGDGIAKAKDSVLALRNQTQAAEDELRTIGFELDSEGSLSLVSRSSRISRTIESRLDAEVGTQDAVLTRPFDEARIKLLLVASAEEAEKIIEPLLNFEVKVK